MAEKIMKKIKQKKDDGTWAEYKIGADAENVTITLNDKKTNVENVLLQLDSNSRKPREITENWNAINTILSTQINGALGYFREGDYLNFPIFFNDTNVKFYIIGIDTYTGTYNNNGKRVGHHIDFCGYSYQKMMSALNSYAGKWTEAENNNSIKENGSIKSAYEYSNVNYELNANMKNIQLAMMKSMGGQAFYPNFSEKTVRLETRYEESQSIQNSNGRTSFLTPIWCLTEYEVLGSCNYSSPRFSSGLSVQYPFFKDPLNRTIFLEGLNSHTCTFPNVVENSSTDLAAFSLTEGSESNSCTSLTWGDCPICFRLEANFEPITTI